MLRFSFNLFILLSSNLKNVAFVDSLQIVIVACFCPMEYNYPIIIRRK